MRINSIPLKDEDMRGIYTVMIAPTHGFILNTFVRRKAANDTKALWTRTKGLDYTRIKVMCFNFRFRRVEYALTLISFGTTL